MWQQMSPAAIRHLWEIKTNSIRWWTHYWIKSQPDSVDMREGIEGRLFPDSAEMWQINTGGKKRSDISDLSPVESKWINPSYRNHSSWLHPSKAKLHYTEKTAAQCVALSPVLPPAFVSDAALYYPWWKYNLPLICAPKPYKSKSSKVATFLHRYYVAFPAPSFNQERLITRDLDCYSFVAAHLRDGLIEERNKRERESVRKQEREDNIVKPLRMTAEDITSRHLFFPEWHQGSVVSFPHLWSHNFPLPHDAAHQIVLLRFPLQHWHSLIFICRQSQIAALRRYP